MAGGGSVSVSARIKRCTVHHCRNLPHLEQSTGELARMGEAATSDQLTEFNIALQNPELFDTRRILAGEWINAPSSNSFSVFEPSTQETLVTVAGFNRNDFLRAIESAYLGSEPYYHLGSP